jgi:hypothetical protein
LRSLCGATFGRPHELRPTESANCGRPYELRPAEPAALN